MSDVVLFAGIRVLEPDSHLVHWAHFPQGSLASHTLCHQQHPSTPAGRSLEPEDTFLGFSYSTQSISRLVLTRTLLLYSSPDLGETRFLTMTMTKWDCSPLPPFTPSGPITRVKSQDNPCGEVQCQIQQKTSYPQRKPQDSAEMCQPEQGRHVGEWFREW